MRYVKDPISGSFLKRFHKDMISDDFDRWEKSVSDVVEAYMSILYPKYEKCLEILKRRKGAIKRELLEEKVIGYFHMSHMAAEKVKEQGNVTHEEEESGKIPFDKSNLCQKSQCDEFHDFLNDDACQNLPGIADCILQCNKKRKKNLDKLKKHFFLGSFEEPSRFAVFLRQNLQPLCNASSVFGDKMMHKRFCFVYNRGLLRFFWKDETLRYVRDVFNQYKDIARKNMFFMDDNMVPYLNLDGIGALPDPKLGYRPKRAKDNYSEVLKALFGEDEKVILGNAFEIEACQVLPVMMLFYWIYLYSSAKAGNDKAASKYVLLYTRCAFQTETGKPESFRL